MTELPSFAFYPQVRRVRNQQEHRRQGKRGVLNPSIPKDDDRGETGRLYTDRLFLLQANFSMICSPF